jgi:hypothetical protein
VKLITILNYIELHCFVPGTIENSLNSQCNTCVNIDNINGNDDDTKNKNGDICLK